MRPKFANIWPNTAGCIPMAMRRATTGHGPCTRRTCGPGRRKFFDLHAAGCHPMAAEALARIARLYVAEDQTQGMNPQARAQRSLPTLQAMHRWGGWRLTADRASLSNS
ncbi:MAG: transposase [Halothiobacillaceae bacterium]|nr:transposase [Halothiobacillaceae bacterium]